MTNVAAVSTAPRARTVATPDAMPGLQPARVRSVLTNGLNVAAANAPTSAARTAVERAIAICRATAASATRMSTRQPMAAAPTTQAGSTDPVRLGRPGATRSSRACAVSWGSSIRESVLAGYRRQASPSHGCSSGPEATRGT
jgi:hypothetical protein